jgi:hypothetical protein
MLLLAVTVALQVGLFALLVPFVGPGNASARAAMMLLPALWAARLVVALRNGRITRRLVRWGGAAGNPTLLRLGNPDVYTRREAPWSFHGYLAFEALVCLLAWVLVGGGVVAGPILDALGVPI